MESIGSAFVAKRDIQWLERMFRVRLESIVYVYMLVIISNLRK